MEPANESVTPHPELSDITPPKPNFAMIFLGIGAFLVLLGFGVLLLYVSQDTRPPQIPVLTPTPTPDRTATVGWKVLTENSKGFSLKYPPEWFAYSDTGSGETTIYDYDVATAVGRGGLPRDHIKIAILRFQKDGYKPSVEDEVAKATPITVGGVVAIRRLYAQPNGMLQIFIPKDDSIYLINVYPGNTFHLPVFEQILTTFQFSAIQSADYYLCQSDIECVVVDSGPCSCMVNGTRSSVNKTYEQVWNQKNAQNRAGIACAQSVSNSWTCTESAIPKCIENKCVLVQN